MGIQVIKELNSEHSIIASIVAFIPCFTVTFPNCRHSNSNNSIVKLFVTHIKSIPMNIKRNFMLKECFVIIIG